MVEEAFDTALERAFSIESHGPGAVSVAKNRSEDAFRRALEEDQGQGVGCGPRGCS
jgi:hypothetical protein